MTYHPSREAFTQTCYTQTLSVRFWGNWYAKKAGYLHNR